MSRTLQEEHDAWRQRVELENDRMEIFKKTGGYYQGRPISNHTRPQSANSQMSRNLEKTQDDYLRSTMQSLTIQQNPILWRKFDPNNYRNSNFDMSYSFGGTRHISHATRDQEDCQQLLQRTFQNGFRPSSQQSSQRSRSSNKRSSKQNNQLSPIKQVRVQSARSDASRNIRMAYIKDLQSRIEAEKAKRATVDEKLKRLTGFTHKI